MFCRIANRVGLWVCGFCNNFKMENYPEENEITSSVCGNGEMSNARLETRIKESVVRASCKPFLFDNGKKVK